MNMTKIVVSTDVRDDDLNDIFIRVELSGHAPKPTPKNFYLIGVIDLNYDKGVYEVRVDDHVAGGRTLLEPQRDVRHALDAVMDYLVEFAVANDLAGAQSLRVLQKD